MRRTAAALRRAALTSALVVAFATAAAAGEPCTRVEMFSREGCPHCAEGKLFLEGLAPRLPALDVRIHDVGRDPEQRNRLAELFERHPDAQRGVPAFLICGELRVGFTSAETSGRQIETLLAGTASPTDAIDVPLLGRLSLRDVGLPVFTLAIGLVDGLNPCAMWVLLFLLSVLVNVRERGRILLIAGTFVFVSGAAYFAFMAAWLEIYQLIGFSRTLQLVLGCVALGIGALHVKDSIALGRGLSLSIPAAARPGIYARTRRIVTAENLPAALAAVLVLAVAVNTVELLCTAGLPALYTQILTLQGLSTAGHYGYLALYTLAYVFDDALMVAIVVGTLRRHKLQETEGRWLKLISGSAVGALGLILLLRPGWLVW